MSTKESTDDLKDLAMKLISDGPTDHLSAAPRRIRIVFNGVYVVDTKKAVYIWEHPYYPQLYIPAAEFKSGVGIEPSKSDSSDGYTIPKLAVGERDTNRVIHFAENDKVPEKLRGLVKVDFKAADAWYEEAVPILVHPKDPYKRVDVLPSAANIKVALHGTTLAETPFSMHLYETKLPVRYYLPLTSISQQHLRPSAKGTKTQCPYKGESEYYDVALKDENGKEQVYSDLVWYYNSPNIECAGIKGMACFYNEKVDVWVDGEKEQQPKTHFA